MVFILVIKSLYSNFRPPLIFCYLSSIIRNGPCLILAAVTTVWTQTPIFYTAESLKGKTWQFTSHSRIVSLSQGINKTSFQHLTLLHLPLSTVLQQQKLFWIAEGNRGDAISCIIATSASYKFLGYTSRPRKKMFVMKTDVGGREM